MKISEGSQKTAGNFVFFAITLVALGFSAVASAAISGDITNASPSSFQGGVPTTVNVAIRVTSTSLFSSTTVNLELRWVSKPSGWSITPPSKTMTITVPPGATYQTNLPFTVTAPVAGGSGTIIWELSGCIPDMNGICIRTPMDTYYQGVGASPSLPDLIVEDITLTPTQVYSGTNTFQRTVRIRNIGGTASISCHLRIETSGAMSGTETVPMYCLSWKWTNP